MEKRAFFEEVLGIKGKDLLEALCEASVIEEYEKDAFLVREETCPAHLLFLLEGICRGYFTSDNGREITDCFVYQKGAPLMGSFGLGEPTVLNVTAETRTRVLSVPMATLIHLLQEHAELVYLYNNLLADALRRHVGIKMAMYRHDAKGKYRWFLENHPGLIDIVKHRHVASFLNMTPESLSRVRKEWK